MKKLKKVWEENKVLLVLAIILIVCLAVFAIVAMTYFYGSSDNVYGNRLDDIKDVPLSDKLLQDIKEELEKNENVSSASVLVKGKIIYISALFTQDTSIDTAKKEAEAILGLFNDDELKVYDIEFTIKNDSEDGYTLMGARNVAGSGIVIWNNHNVDSESANKNEKA